MVRSDSTASEKEKILQPEPPQTEERRLTIERNVPSDAIYMAFRMGGRTSGTLYRRFMF